MSRKQIRWRRWLIAAGVVLIVYTIVGFFVIPMVVRTQMQERGSEALARVVHVERVRFNPFTFEAAVEGLRIEEASGEPLASWKAVRVDFDPLDSLWRWQLFFSDVEIVEPKKWIRIDADGRANVADLVPASADDEAASGEEAILLSEALPPLGVGRARIEGWSVDFSDASLARPFHAVVGPMDFELSDFTTRPDRDSPYALTGTTALGETFSWTGTVSVAPLGSKGTLRFSGFRLPKYGPYADAFLRARIRTGRVSFATDYEVALDGGLVARLANAHLAIEDFAVGSIDAEEPEAKIARLAVDVESADAVARTARISRVALDGVDLAVMRREDGSIDLMDWLPVSEGSGVDGGEVEAETGPAPSVAIDEIAVRGGRIRIADLTTAEPVSLTIDDLAVELRGAGTDLDREVAVTASARVEGDGQMKLAGRVRPLPFAAELEMHAGQLPLAAVEPFVREFADVRIRNGAVSFDGLVKAELPRGGDLLASCDGDTSIEGLSVWDGEGEAMLMGVETLAVQGLRATVSPMSIRIAEIGIDSPQAHVRRDAEGRINLLTALGIDMAEDEAESAQALEEARAESETTSEIVARATRRKLPFDVAIDAIRISDGLFTFRDEAVPAGFSTRLEDFSGRIEGLSSENLARADVEIVGMLDGQAPLKISGQINPLAEDAFSDLTLSFRNINMPLFSPYAGQYIGQTIAKGKLTVEVAYRVSQSVLEGENAVVLDQFYLGEKVDSPDALKLPFGLALALLRDREGKISLDVPVRGNLDDPDFKYGRALMKVVGNVIVKAATSPFAMLGSIVGGGASGEDLSFVDFASGTEALDEAAMAKLELLSKALYERPALRLEITSPVWPEGDLGGLREVKLQALLRAEKAAMAAEEAVAAADEHEGRKDLGAAPVEAIAEEEMPVLLRRVFARLFPEEASAVMADADATDAESGQGTSAGGESTAAPAGSEDGKNPGMLTRVWRSIFGGRSAPEAVAGENGAAEVAAEAEGAAAVAEAAAPVLSIDEMRQRILETIQVDEADFRALAERRARRVRDAILAAGMIEPERVFIVESAALPEKAEIPESGGRVYFGLQ